MSYLYELCYHFYDEMKSLTRSNDDIVNKQFKNSSDSIDRKIKEFYSRILIDKEKYYITLLKIVDYYGFIDVDLVCDCLIECEFEKLPLIKGNEQLMKELKKYQDLENENLKYTIYKLIKTLECLRLFINIVRHKYLPDFLEKDNSKKKVIVFFRDLIYSKRIHDIRLNKSNYTDEASILDLIAESKKNKMDYISFFVDSSECSLLIIEQQKYYINELERLIDKIDEFGNCTGLDSNKYEVFLKFIYSMKDCAIKKIELINNVEKRFVVKN